MATDIADAIADLGRIHTLAGELVLQISANSLQDKTVDEARSLSEEGRRQLARVIFRQNFDVALIYNTGVNSHLGPAAELPYGV